MISKSELQNYYDCISKGLAFAPARQRQVVTSLKTSINAYLADHPDAQIEDIFELFGESDAIIQDNTERVPETKVVQSKRYSKVILCSIAVIAAVVVVFMAFNLIDGKNKEQNPSKTSTASIPAYLHNTHATR